MKRTRPGRGITAPRGFRAAGGTCGIKDSGAPDLMMIVADRLCPAAAVFTRSRTPAAPVIVDRQHLRATGGMARAIVCNSGNANASTGRQGLLDARAMCRLVAGQVGCHGREVLVCSTGLIGAMLPMDRIDRGIATLASRLGRGDGPDADAARAILTTDLVTKSACRTIRLDGKRVRLAGIAKGSGMIAPDMATLLVFITTDAAATPATLRRALQRAVDASFNRISVDQHTSPSDTVLLLASGAAGNAPVTSTRRDDLAAFTAALTDLCSDLAYQIVADGEGATRVFVVDVTGARSVRDADRIGRAIVNSPLVKTAVHGADPNWGRIITAAGYAGAAVRPDKMSLHIGDTCVFDRGRPVEPDRRTARRLVGLMRRKQVVFTLDLGLGRAEARWLGCDLSRQYIAINADYTT